MVEIVELHEVLSTGPIIVSPGSIQHTVDRCQIIHGHAAVCAEPVEQGLVQIECLRRFCDGQHQKATVKVAFGKELAVKCSEFFFCKIAVPGKQLVRAHDFSNTGIGGEQVGQVFRAWFSICGSRKCLVNGRGTGYRHYVDGNAVLFADRAVENIDSSIQRRLRLASVDMPHG